jgi:glycosyltransferase involved in cell wall biosynthesis
VRVVFSAHAYSPSIGGAERYTQGLAEGLAGLGHEVHVVVPDIEDPEAFYEVGHKSVGTAVEATGGLTVHRLPYVGTAYRHLGPVIGEKWALAQSTRRFLGFLGERISSLEPDVVVTLPHLFPNVEEVIRLRSGATWGLAYAPMLHEDDPYWSIDRVAAAVAEVDGVIALTDHERTRLVESYGAGAETTIVIPPGVEPGEGLPYGERDLVVLFVGRRTESKRLDVLFEAMKIVWGEFPDVVLQVAGSPPGMGRDPAVWMAADRRVRIIDSPSETEKDRLLGRARLVVSPSLTESFGITTLEAWAGSTPVVVADSPVSRSIVRDGVDGLIADGPEARHLAAAISRLLRDTEGAKTMGGEGQSRAETEFSWLASVESLDRLLTAL